MIGWLPGPMNDDEKNFIKRCFRGVSIVLLLLSFAFCNFGILNPDWVYYNDDIAFGPLGGPICYHSHTSDVQKCKEAFQNVLGAFFGCVILALLAVGPAIGVIALCCLIHDSLSEDLSMLFPLISVIVGSFYCVMGLVVVNEGLGHILNKNITGFDHHPSYNYSIPYITGCIMMILSIFTVVGRLLLDL